MSDPQSHDDHDHPGTDDDSPIPVPTPEHAQERSTDGGEREVPEGEDQEAPPTAPTPEHAKRPVEAPEGETDA